MKAKEIKELSSEDLAQKMNDLKDELFKLRFQLATGQLENPLRIREVRRGIAKAKTLLREREIKAQQG